MRVKGEVKGIKWRVKRNRNRRSETFSRRN